MGNLTTLCLMFWGSARFSQEATSHDLPPTMSEGSDPSAACQHLPWFSFMAASSCPSRCDVNSQVSSSFFWNEEGVLTYYFLGKEDSVKIKHTLRFASFLLLLKAIVYLLCATVSRFKSRSGWRTWLVGERGKPVCCGQGACWPDYVTVTEMGGARDRTPSDPSPPVSEMRPISAQVTATAYGDTVSPFKDVPMHNTTERSQTATPLEKQKALGGESHRG